MMKCIFHIFIFNQIGLYFIDNRTRIYVKTEFEHKFHCAKLTLAKCSVICQLQSPGAQLIASDIGSPE